MTSPYAHSRTEQEFAPQDFSDALRSGYAVPNPAEGDAPYNDTFGWAPSLRLGPESVPDSSRLMEQPRRDYRPDPIRPPVEGFWPGLDHDKAVRHSVEYQDADGWTENKDYPAYPNPRAGANRWGRNPRENPPPEPRWTTALAQRTYTFTRPFLQGLPKEGALLFNGTHFSMADHRRTYEILGMMPPKSRRNTYRINPGPWDAGVTDMPPANAVPPPLQEAPMSFASPPATRSLRLQ